MMPRQKAIVIVNDCMASIDYDTYYEDGFMFGRFITREVIEALQKNEHQNKELIEYWKSVEQEMVKLEENEEML